MNPNVILKSELRIAYFLLLATIGKGFVHDKPSTIISRNHQLQQQVSSASRDVSLDMKPIIDHESASMELRYKQLSQEEEQESGWINKWFEDHLPHFEAPSRRQSEKKRMLHDNLVEVSMNKENMMFLNYNSLTDAFLQNADRWTEICLVLS
jgi:hypothetical protein